MRRAEQFLVAFAVLSLVLRYAGIKDAVPLEIIGMSLLALFYAVLYAPMQLHNLGSTSLSRRGMLIALLIFCGLATAYMLVALLRFTLNLQPDLDTVENAGVLLTAIGLGTGILLRKKPLMAYQIILLRPVLVFGVICLATCFPPERLHLHGM